MAAPRRVFVKIRDFSQDSAVLRPKPPSEPRPLLPSRLPEVRPSTRRLPVLPSIPKLEQPARRRGLIKSASPSRLEDAAILHCEEVCNPYELEEGPRADQRLGKGSFAQKVDLRKGSFSKKQIVSPRRLTASLAPQPATRPPEEPLPVSPQVSSRNLRIAQISRRFVISKESLEQRNSKHRAFLSEPVPAKPVKPVKSQSVEPAPYAEWLDSLHEVTRVHDFALKVKPAFVPKRRVKLTR